MRFHVSPRFFLNNFLPSHYIKHNFKKVAVLLATIVVLLDAAPYKQRYFPQQSGYYPSVYGGYPSVDDYYGYSPYGSSSYPYYYGAGQQNIRRGNPYYQSAAYPSAYPSAYPGFGWPSRWSPFTRFGAAVQVN